MYRRFPFDDKFRFDRIPGNFQRRMEQHFPEFLVKRTTSGGEPKFLKVSYREFQFHSIFLPEFPGFSTEWFLISEI